MSKPSPEILQTYIADVLFGNGSLTPEDSVNNVTQERMFAAGAIERIGDSDIAKAIYRELGYMVDRKYVDREPSDQYGQVKYRLSDKGRINYYGTNEEKMREFWGINGLTIALALGNLAVTLFATILTLVFKK